MERRLQRLDRLDREHGVGASTHLLNQPSRRSPSALLVLALTIALICGLILLMPGLLPYSVRNAVHLARQRELPKVTAGSSTDYAALTTQSDGTTPVTWDPCHPIHYVINPNGAPPGGVDIVRSAIGRVQQASGLRFTDDGLTTLRPQWKSHTTPFGLPDHGPVVIGWATSEEISAFQGDAAGLGGPAAAVRSGGPLTYVTGAVALNSAKFARIASRHDDAEERAIVLHELGHLVGLAHVNDPTQLMNPTLANPRDYAAGDLAGLARLGSGPCR